MSQLEYRSLFDAGLHFGHLTKKWNPKMAPFIFMKHNGIHVIDLKQTMARMQDAASYLKNLVHAGKKVLFVATKKQAKSCVERVAKSLSMPYVTERWLGGTLTNFVTIRRLVKRMVSIDKTMQSEAYQGLAKKERLVIAREHGKLLKLLSGLSNVTRLPSALFVVDVVKEHIAVKEANRLGIPVFALVDTNADPDNIDFVIPGNDDAVRSIELVVSYVASAMHEGFELYKQDKVRASKELSGKEKQSVSHGGGGDEISS